MIVVTDQEISLILIENSPTLRLMGTPFIAKNKVRMHDTDMAGLLYFPRQFRFATDALEDYLEKEGYGFAKMFLEDKFVFVIVHAEADYFLPLLVGDPLEVHLICSAMGDSSFTLDFQIYRLPKKELVGSAQTVHVTLDSKTRKKIPLPEPMKKSLEIHFIKK